MPDSFDPVAFFGAGEALPEAVRTAREEQGRSAFAAMQGADKGAPFYQIQGMKEIHHHIIRLVIQDPTLSHKEIAAMLGVSSVMVSYTLRGELGRARVEMLRGSLDQASLDVGQEITQLAALAISRKRQILESDFVKAELHDKVASDILDRAGYVKPNAPQVNINYATAEDLAEILAKAKASKQVIVDADAVFEDAEVLE